ncbi:MAG: hypothetical protein ACQETH_12120 [Candidatus Rifleibacteriota bacterium]
MSTSFEFLPEENYQIKFPLSSLLIFIGSAVLFFLILNFMNFYIEGLQQEYNEAAARVEKQASGFIARAEKLLPEMEQIQNLEQQIERHNSAIGGERSVWTKLFNKLEDVLPEEAIISSIKNDKNQATEFAAEDRTFKLLLKTPDMQFANLLYMNISEDSAFESVSFKPSAEKTPVSDAVVIELSFKFNPEYD